MIPQQVIHKAIDGGWRYVGGRSWHVNVLDPYFWQALDLGHSSKGGSNARWLKTAHHFYDLVLQEQDTTEFWKELLFVSDKRTIKL